MVLVTPRDPGRWEIKWITTASHRGCTRDDDVALPLVYSAVPDGSPEGVKGEIAANMRSSVSKVWRG